MTVHNVCSLNAVRRALKEGSNRKEAVRTGYGIAREMIEDGMMRSSPVADRVLEGHAKRFATLRGKAAPADPFMSELDQAMAILSRTLDMVECGWCEGKGITKYRPAQTCEFCNGQGVREP